MNLRKAAEQALECLEYHWDNPDSDLEDTPYVLEAKQALRQALGTEQEGCAQCGKQASQGWALYCVECVEGKREWVGLTDDDIHDAFNYVEMVKLLDFDRDRPEWCEAFARACEARLRHRNGEKQ